MGWINIYWKNRNDPLFDYLRPSIRDKINNSLSQNFIVENGGKCEIKDKYLHLEFKKLSIPEELQEWMHRTRFKSIPIKVIVGVETEEVRVDGVDSIQLIGEILHVKGSENLEKTLFCYLKNNKIMCELYDLFIGERVDTGRIKFTLPGRIKELKEIYPILEKRDDGVIFDIKPKIIDAKEISFDDRALIYSKQLREKILSIKLNSSKWQMERYL